ncbi:MAG: DUF2796 domain-containing protein [Pararhodobacter sp.]
MRTLALALLTSAIAAPLAAQEHRELAAHVHGVSTLEIAIEGNTLALNLLSPGADIVGFEYEATSEADKDAVEAAIQLLLQPDEIFALPDAAGCRVSEVLAHLHGAGHDHEGHGHDDHGHEGHSHGHGHAHDDDGHDHHGHDDHAHDDHGHDHDHAEADHAHDDHAHEEHTHEDGHGHEDHAHDHGGHSEFHARYTFTCDNPQALTSIGFPFFGHFPNAREIEAQYVTDAGAGAAEITRDAATLPLE